MTTKFTLLAIALVLVSATGSAAPLCTSLTTLADYASAGSCDVATGETFSNFSWVSAGVTTNGVHTSLPASAVNVVVINSGHGFLGLQFSASQFDNIQAGISPINGRPVAGSLSFTLGYTLTLPLASGWVDGVSALVSGFHNTGSSSMAFNVSEIDESDPSNSVTLILNQTSTYSFDLFVPKVQAIDIVESVGLTAVRGTNDIIGFSSFDNTFSVPEPMTMFLFGSGLVVIGLAGRRLRHLK